MVRLLLPIGAALAACAPSPPKADSRTPDTAAPGASETEASGTREAAGPAAGAQGQAAVGPAPEPVSAAENPAPAFAADSPAEAEGRRTLSTAFVRVGADGHLTVERRDGRVLVLRDVVMRPGDYCGIQVAGDRAGGRYCGGYGEVAAARPGGAPAPAEPVPADANPIEAPRGGR